MRDGELRRVKVRQVVKSAGLNFRQQRASEIDLDFRGVRVAFAEESQEPSEFEWRLVTDDRCTGGFAELARLFVGILDFAKLVDELRREGVPARHHASIGNAIAQLVLRKIALLGDNANELSVSLHD